MSKSPIALSILVLCLVVAIGQNWSPSVSIAFLGTTSIALPLGIWVGLAIAAGVMTAIVISWLFQRAGSSRSNVPRASIGGSSPPPAPDRTAAEPTRDRDRPPVNAPTDESYKPLSNPRLRTDPLTEDRPTEEWDDEEEWVGRDVGPVEGDNVDGESPQGNNPPSFEVKQEPVPTYQEGSIYSYSYREDRADTGRTDDIYAVADDERHEASNTAPVSPERESLESEIVTPFPEMVPESLTEDVRPPEDDRPTQSEKSSSSLDDDWTSSSKQDREEW